MTTQPFAALVDDRGLPLPYVALTAPMLTADDRSRLARLRHGPPMIGFTSYMDFPIPRRLWPDHDYRSMCVAWCHCFREPERFLPSDRRWLHLAHADLLDWSRVAPNLASPQEPRQRDFVYVCEPGPWKEYTKNWALAKRCLPVLTGELGLTGLLVGRGALSDLPGRPGQIQVRDRVPWQELMAAVAGARFLFMPSELDACPRIIAEALACNTAVVVNRKILGGWHYVNPFTGAFFDDETDVAQAIARLSSQPLSPRRWFTANHGHLHAGARLARFMTQIDASCRASRTIHLEPWP